MYHVSNPTQDAKYTPECGARRSSARLLRQAASLLVLAGVPLAGPGAGEDDPPASEYNLTALRLSTEDLQLDGQLNELVWLTAEPITGFMQRDPDEGEPASERTEVRVLYDDGAIYVGIRAYDSDPDGIVGRLTRRDAWSPSDWLVVSIDSYHDRRTAFEFWASPVGVERDLYRYDDTRMDFAWDAVWDVATSVDSEGWTAEFRIPLSQLRFAPAPEQLWGFNVTRVIQRKNETALWKPIPKEGSGWVSEYGELQVGALNPPMRLEVLPYVLSRGAVTPRLDDNPFETGSEFSGNAGADVRYGLTSALTLNVTVNPDFGQVEADPSSVNLTVFETFFQEKRPFFVEGSNIFNYHLTGGRGQQQLFYSRRIGRAPQGGADERGGFVDMPLQANILAAAKLSGKTPSGWSIGVLDAVTSSAQATVVDSLGNIHRDVVEPRTNYAMARLQRDFRSGKSAIGGIFTATNRTHNGNTNFLHSAAYAWGLDGRHRFWGDNWEVAGRFNGSVVRGATEAIERTQQRSSRMFQRIDAQHLTLDPTRTSLNGTSGGLSVAKIGGGGWRTTGRFEWISPGFEANDLGFQPRADDLLGFANVGYRKFQPGKLFRRAMVDLDAWTNYTFGGERTQTAMSLRSNFTLLNYWGGFLGGSRRFEALNTRLLRGGPAMVWPGATSIWGGVFSDDRKPIIVNLGSWYNWDDARSDRGGVWADFIVQPGENVRITVGPEFNFNRDDQQYVTSAEALGANHYVVGALDQKTVYLTTRLDWTFTPNLSLQLYAQPFVSAGTYGGFKEVTDSRAAGYDDRFETFGSDRLRFEDDEYFVDLDGSGEDDFSFDNPDFNIRELRSTVVLRWEYRSGSTIFLVWSSSRSASGQSGAFRPGRDIVDLFGTSGTNVFMLKVNYYLTP